jgi:hypothetical protein
MLLCLFASVLVIGAVVAVRPSNSPESVQKNLMAIDQGSGIIWDGTDFNTTLTQQVPNLNATISPRTVIEYADSVPQLGVNAPLGLNTTGITPRIISEYADYASYIAFPLQPYTGPGFPHDLAVENLLCSKTIVAQNYSCWPNVTVVNDGEFSEDSSVIVYLNATIIGTLTVRNLTRGSFEAIVLNWTANLAYGNYILSAYLLPVPNEIYTENNDLNMSGFLTITIPGDINGDFKVSLSDLTLLAIAYGSKSGDPKWNPNADINGDGKVSLSDLTLLAIHYGQHYP